MTTEVQSSKIASVNYDPVAMILKITFRKDGTFEYYGVPERLYNELLEANSHGVYFKMNIKDQFRHVKIQA